MSLILDNRYVNLLGTRLEQFSRMRDSVYNFRCPYCGDSQRSLSKKRGYIFEDTKGGKLFFKCHNCLVNKQFKWFLKDIDETLYRQYIMELLKQDVSGLDELDVEVKKPKKINYLTYDNFLFGLPNMEQLPDDNPCKQYILKRKIPKKYWKHLYFTENYNKMCYQFTGEQNDKIPEDSRLVIPFIEDNKVLTIQGRALEKGAMRYITVKASNEVVKVYGMNMIDPEQEVRVVEGPIDSMFVRNCVASADSSLTKIAHLFKNRVFIFDNEPRNGNIVKFIDKAIQNKYKVCLLPPTGYKDFNDMVKLGGYTEDDIEELIKTNTYRGLKAKLKFADWKKV